MRVAYLHCFSGISGDMFLGALVDAGVPIELLQSTAKALRLGAELQLERVDRSGLSALKVHVLELGQKVEVAESAASRDHHQHSDHQQHHVHEHTHEHNHDPVHKHAHEQAPAYSHSHGALTEHTHVHARSPSAIRSLIEQADLAPEIKSTSIRAFDLLGSSEAKMHNLPIEEVHFHEVGAVDAIIDIVCGCAGALSLNVDEWVSSPLNVGSGTVRCAHGIFPVPAPATLDLLQDIPIYSEGPEGERVTPTGAALLRVLNCNFGPMPPMRARRTGYGAGSRNPESYPNVVRLTLGDSQPSLQTSSPHNEAVRVLETAIDDSTPQVLGFLMDAALAAGALDVMMSSVHMKKNRPGTLITILCLPEDTDRFCEMLFRETSTIGIRTRLDSRHCLDRELLPVQTTWGAVNLKVSRLNGKILNVAPEFEDCRRLADLYHLPLKHIQNAAIAACTQKGADEAGENTDSAHL